MPLIQESQIVHCSTQNQTLLGEVIQVLPKRANCWIRPLVLVDNKEHNNYIDLRSCSDLVMPIAFFEPALDTEILPILNYLAKNHQSVLEFQANHPQLTLFLRELLSQPDECH